MVVWVILLIHFVKFSSYLLTTTSNLSILYVYTYGFVVPNPSVCSRKYPIHRDSRLSYYTVRQFLQHTGSLESFFMKYVSKINQEHNLSETWHPFVRSTVGHVSSVSLNSSLSSLPRLLQVSLVSVLTWRITFPSPLLYSSNPRQPEILQILIVTKGRISET